VTRVERLVGAAAGTEVVCDVDLVVTDDWTTPALFEPLDALGTRRAATRVVLVHDHTNPPTAYRGAERAVAERRLAERDAFLERFGCDCIEGEGIQHHVLPRLGVLRPGMLVLGNDSHTPTLGAFGVLALAAQPSTIAAAIHTGRTPFRVPETFSVRVEGRLRSSVSARDAALELLAALRGDASLPWPATGKALEFDGPGIEVLTPEERAVLANVTPEALALTATFPLPGRRHEPSDARADLVLDLDRVAPAVARSGHAADVVRLERFGRRAVDRVFVGTCAGGTATEIRAFAEALGERAVVPTVVAPATRAVVEALRREGVWQALEAAGVELLPPGCGPCFGFGVGRLAAGEVAVSTGNRNGVGRMGAVGSHVHLVAGRTAGEAARTGFVGSASSDAGAEERSPSLRPPRIAWPSGGNVVRLHGLVTTDDLTPSSVPGVGTSSDRDPDVLRRLLLHHVDPAAAERDLRGSVIVADHGFGAGSNRASSVRALLQAGVVAVIARSIAPLYAAGARDEGLLAIVLDDDAFYQALGADAIVRVDALSGAVLVAERRFEVPPATPLEQGVRTAGGVVPYLRAYGAWSARAAACTRGGRRPVTGASDDLA